MSWGTTVKTYVRRVHPATAGDELADATDTTTHLEHMLLARMAATPPEESGLFDAWTRENLRLLADLIDSVIQLHRVSLVANAIDDEIVEVD